MNPSRNQADIPGNRFTLARAGVEIAVADHLIRIMCPNLACRRILAVPITARGKVVKCSGCGKNVRVPQTTVTPSEPKESEDAAAS